MVHQHSPSTVLMIVQPQSQTSTQRKTNADERKDDCDDGADVEA
jgi:hypothetical protein